MQIKSLQNTVILTINDDPNRVIEFNPSDIGFVERFFALMDSVEEKEAEYRNRLEELKEDTSMNSYGVPKAVGKEIKLTAEICAYMREQIDTVFGSGTSQTVFGEINTVDMFAEFFSGIAPHISAARSEAVKKYTEADSGALK